jgi:hypothetical protein
VHQSFSLRAGTPQSGNASIQERFCGVASAPIGVTLTWCAERWCAERWYYYIFANVFLSSAWVKMPFCFLPHAGSCTTGSCRVKRHFVFMNVSLNSMTHVKMSFFLLDVLMLNSYRGVALAATW